MTHDLPRLFNPSQEELDRIFVGSPAGDIPDGEAQGTAIIGPGTRYTPDIAKLINHFAWQGKVFDARRGVLKSRCVAPGLQAVIANVYKAASWLDDNECIVLDYSQTSGIAHRIRDEIRLIAPGHYLGVVYWDRARLIHFALQF